jgi:hypothetical protein
LVSDSTEVGEQMRVLEWALGVLRRMSEGAPAAVLVEAKEAT